MVMVATTITRHDLSWLMDVIWDEIAKVEYWHGDEMTKKERKNIDSVKRVADFSYDPYRKTFELAEIYQQIKLTYCKKRDRKNGELLYKVIYDYAQELG